jgi:hypothetical protein
MRVLKGARKLLLDTARLLPGFETCTKSKLWQVHLLKGGLEDVQFYDFPESSLAGIFASWVSTSLQVG